jgi:hypothetical protein
MHQRSASLHRLRALKSELAQSLNISAKVLLKKQVLFPLPCQPRAKQGSNRRSRPERRRVDRFRGSSPRVKGPTPRPGRRSRVMAPMAVPSHRRRTGTVACDGIPTDAAAVAAPPPPTIAGDLCACIPGPTSRSPFFLPRWFIPRVLLGSIRRDSRVGLRLLLHLPRRGLAVRFSLTRN